jgi:hypothetical protein
VNPDKRKPPPRTGAYATTRPDQSEAYTGLDHVGHMRLLDDRIRWLETHRHWWLRTDDGRAQREFLDRRGAA